MLFFKFQKIKKRYLGESRGYTDQISLQSPHRVSHQDTNDRPLVLVSFADTTSVDLFAPAILNLLEHCDVRVSGSPELFTDVASLQDLVKTTPAFDWKSSVDFARYIVDTDLLQSPFILRLPLSAATLEQKTASEQAVSALAMPDACTKMREAFLCDPDLTMIGPDTLFKPLFSVLGSNGYAMGELESSTQTTLMSNTPSTFPCQSFAIARTALVRLRPVLKRFEGILALERKSVPYGQTGNIGVAMDSSWNSLALGENGKLGLIRRRLDDNIVVLRIGDASRFAQELGRFSCLETTLKRLKRVKPDFSLLTREPDFNADNYMSRNAKHVPDTFGALEHFVTFGDAVGLSDNTRLDMGKYRLSVGAMLAPFDNTLCHWIVRGRPTLNLKVDHWLKLAKSRQLFDPEWMASTYPELGSSEDIENNYKKSKELWTQATSVNFDPREIPTLYSAAPDQKNKGLREFMCHYFFLEQQAYTKLHLLLQSNELVSARKMTREIQADYGTTVALQGAQAYLSILDGDWADAREAMDKLWEAFESGQKTIRHTPSLLGDYNTDNVHVFKTTRKGFAPDLKKVCIYTTIFGESDTLLPVLSPSSDISLICFSDRPRVAPGWEVRVVTPISSSSNLSAKYYKVLPYENLQEFRYSIFVDGNTLLMGNLEKLVCNFLAGNPFVMWRHPDRSDLFREVVAILQSGRHRPHEVFEQIKAYREKGLPPKSGLTEGSFIWRDHQDSDTREFMEEWWAEILKHSKRDQLSLGYLFWQRNQRPRVLPSRLGTSRRNAFFVKLPHRNPHSRSMPGKKASVTFLYDPARKESGSTVMRGEQLSQMVAEAFPDREISYASGLNWQGRILFLTKGFLEKASTEALQDLRARGNFLIADFVDAQPDIAKAANVDAFAAASFAAYEFYARTFPDTPVFHLTHHVDPRIKMGNEATGFKPAYIGEEVNAVWTPEIRDRVSLVQVNTKKRDDDWLSDLRNHNFHYAVRNPRDIDGFKPFLKGFTAARCGAPILAQKTIGDAVFYLGEDYPFLLPADPTNDEILGMLDKAQSCFEGPIWLQAKERMRSIAERTSRAAVITEFEQILKS